MGLFSEYQQVTRLLQQPQQLVFYAESRHYYAYYQHLIEAVLHTRKIKICYITSDSQDPLLTTAPEGMHVIYVKWMLGFLFPRLRARMMLMTMPDLQNFLFKRSPQTSHYGYIFHAAVSTHQQYRFNAFFHYDSIFCTGPYQVDEIQKTETHYQTSHKELIHYGYPLLDAIREKKVALSSAQEKEKPVILVAPSWFEGCILDTCIAPLLEELSRLPYTIIVRLHAEYVKRRKKAYQQLLQIVNRYPAISIDNWPNVIDRLPMTDILITDRSGIALEFAFGTGQPVLFIDTALKQTNPDWEKIGIEPLENRLRSQLGVAISTTDMQQLAAAIATIEQLKPGFGQKMDELKHEVFYSSYQSGLEFILAKMEA